MINKSNQVIEIMTCHDILPLTFVQVTNYIDVTMLNNVTMLPCIGAPFYEVPKVS